MSEEIISSIKKEALSRASAAAAHTSTSILAIPTNGEIEPVIPESKGLRSESPITLSYGRVFQGDGENFELILLHCYQRLIDSNDNPTIAQLCGWFQTQKRLNITFTSPQLAGLMPAKICFTPTYSFNSESLLPILKEVPDIHVPTRIKALVNDYIKEKSVWSVKSACLQLIATLVDQIYSNNDNFDINKRKEQLARLITFLSYLRDRTEFSFLVGKGKRFKSFLESCHQALQSGLTEIDRLLQKPLQIEKWLAAYHMHATELLEQLIPYSDHLLQDISISESSQQVLANNIYDIYKNIVKQTFAISLSEARAKAIYGTLMKSIATIQKAGFDKQPITLDELKNLVAIKKLTLVEAGFYYDYYLNNPTSWPELASAVSGKKPYTLTADQFLRELIYGFKELAKFKGNVVLQAALSIYKSKMDDRAEYALTMLRCRVLSPKNLLDEALHLKQQPHQSDKAAVYLNLAKQAFNPILIDLSADNVDIWQPGIIATLKNLADFNRSASQTAQYQIFAKTVLSLMSVYPQLSAYSWFTKSLEWATKGQGNDTIAVVYREFLQSLSKHTLDTILPVISRVLLAMDATNGSSLRNKLRIDMQEYKANESIQRWQHQQASIEQKPFYRSLLRSLLILKNICKELDKYVSDSNILAAIKEDQDLASMLISACDSIDKSLPDAKQQLTSAKVFFDDMHYRLYKLLNGDKENKGHPPQVGPIEVKVEQTKIDFPPPAEFPDSKHEELIEKLSILTAQRDRIHKLKSEGHSHSKLDKKQDEMDKQISAIENRLQNVRSKQPEQKHDQTITSTNLPATPLSTLSVSPIKPKHPSPPKEQKEPNINPEIIATTPPADHKDSVIKKLDSYLSDSLYEAISLPTLLQEFLLQAKDIANSLSYQSLTISRIHYEKIGNIFSKISKKISDTDENFTAIKAQMVVIKKDLVDEISVIFVSQLQAEEEPDTRSQELHRLNQTLLKELQTMLAQVIQLNQISYSQYNTSSSFSRSHSSIAYEHKATTTTVSQPSTPNPKRRASTTGSSNLFPTPPKVDTKALKSRQEQYLYLPATDEDAASSTAIITTYLTHTTIVEEDLEDEDQRKCVIS